MALTKQGLWSKWTSAAGAGLVAAGLSLAPLSAAYGQSATQSQTTSHTTSQNQIPPEGTLVTGEQARQISEDCGVVVIHEGQDIGGTKSDAWVLRTEERINTISLKGKHLGYATIHICGMTSPYQYSQDDVAYGKVVQAVRKNYPAMLEYARSTRQTASLAPSAQAQ